MEKTLGKRISKHRKKLGLTQDKLAETLGVTAQAVSKWENDQSCPDITLLPKLSALFGITTDELLGVVAEKEEAPAVLEGTVEDNHSQTEKPGLELNWEPGKRDAIFISVFILAVGALTLLSVLFHLNVSFWNILWPCAILGVGIRGLLRKFSFFSVVCTLFGCYFLLENMTITDLNVSWKLVFPILILLLGITLLLDSFKQPKRSRWNIRHKGKDIYQNNPKGNLVNDFSVDGETFTCALHFGDNYRNVVMDRLSKGQIDCSFGDLTVDLTGCGEFAENCHLRTDCSFGSLTILLPKSVRVVPNTSTAFAGLDIEGSPDPNPPHIMSIDADVSFGAITVCYQ